jgi:hypothetical protein
MQNFRRLKNYKPSEYKAPMSVYREKYADAAVLFCQHLRHTTGKWYGQPFQLIDWQERLLRDLFGIVKQHNRCRQFRTAYVEIARVSPFFCAVTVAFTIQSGLLSLSVFAFFKSAINLSDFSIFALIAETFSLDGFVIFSLHYQHFER